MESCSFGCTCLWATVPLTMSLLPNPITQSPAAFGCECTLSRSATSVRYNDDITITVEDQRYVGPLLLTSVGREREKQVNSKGSFHLTLSSSESLIQTLTFDYDGSLGIVHRPQRPLMPFICLCMWLGNERGHTFSSIGTKDTLPWLLLEVQDVESVPTWNPLIKILRCVCVCLEFFFHLSRNTFVTCEVTDIGPDWGSGPQSLS